MTPQTDIRSKNLIRRRWLATMLAVLLISLVRVAGYSTAKFESRPMDAHVASVYSLTTFCPSSDNNAVEIAGVSGHDKGSYLLFLHTVPSQDGTELYISAGGTGELGGAVFANIGIGPGHDKGSYTMVYSDTEQTYVTTATGFTPGVDDYASLSITTTLGLDTGVVDFYRAYVPASTTQAINSIDGNLQLTLVSTDTITFDTYVAVVPSYAPPGPVPAGHHLVGSAYSIRAAGALVCADRPMNLRLYYDEATLAGADPHTLAVFVWDAHNELWENLGGRLFYDQSYLSVATPCFATYALMSTPAWRDEFDDFNGLSFPGETHHVTLGGTLENRAVVLVGTATSGVAVSKPITPATSFDSWGNLAFTRTIAPPTTTLSVDVLSLDGSEVLTDVVSGVSLADLDPGQYPALKLRANLSATVLGETPALDVWQLTWQPESLPAPTITAVWPLSASNWVTTSLTVTGSGFLSTTQVRLGSSFTLPVVTFVTTQSLNGLVPPGLSPGDYDVTAVNPDGQSGTLPGGFTVTDVPPYRICLPLVLKQE